MPLAWHCVEIRAESATDTTVIEMGAKLHRPLDHDHIQCSLSCAEFCKNILLNGMICVIFYLTVCIILENTFKIQHFAASSQKEHGHYHAEWVNITGPNLNGKTKLNDICACDETLLKSKTCKSEGKRLISKSIATCLINKGPQIPASSQIAYFYSSLTFLRGTQKMALLGSPCPSQV